MRIALLILIIFGACLFTSEIQADAPATEFFAIETSKLAKLAPTDAALDALSSNELGKIGIAQGWYGGGLSMTFETKTFRIDARFSRSANPDGLEIASIEYNINASAHPNSWDLFQEHGVAKKLGKQFVTEGWRSQPITIVLRLINLKH